MSDSDEGSIDEKFDPFELVERYEEELLECSELIDHALNENLKKNPYKLAREDHISAVQSALRVEIDSDGDANSLARAILHHIAMPSGDGLTDNLKERGIDRRVIVLFNKWRSSYSIESREPNYRSYQGEDFWRQITTDFAIRAQTGEYGLNHTIEKAKGESVKISTSLDSNMNLVNILLRKQIAALEQFDDDALEQVSEHLVDELEESVNEIKSLTIENE